jgi:hypothetical protein
MGLMIGYPSVALGYLSSRAGLPVSAAAAMVGSAFFAHAFKFIWAPLADYSLSRKAWYRLAIGVMSLVIVALTATPLREANVPLLSVLVLAGNFAATFVAFATEGLMAHNAGPGGRGRASGWFQSGNQFGQTAGGGLGLWLTKHLPEPWMAGAVLALDPRRLLGGAASDSRSPRVFRRAPASAIVCAMPGASSSRCSGVAAGASGCSWRSSPSGPGRLSSSSDRLVPSGTLPPTPSRLRWGSAEGSRSSRGA